MPLTRWCGVFKEILTQPISLRGLFWDTCIPTIVIHLILTTLVFISCKMLTFDESHSKHRIAETEGRNIEAVMNKLTAPCNM